MNALTPINTGGSSLVPHDMTAAMQLANLMSTGKLVPAHLQKSPGDCLMVIEQAMRWNMSPFAVAQCTSVVQGKLMFEGKLVAAAVQSSGILDGRLSYEFTGEGDKRGIIVKGTIRGETIARDLPVALKDAKTTNGMWAKQPDQQLVYFATRAWARRHVPEVMLGVYSPEEFDGRRPDNFTGTTLEGLTIRPDPEQVMQPIESAPKKPSVTQWLDALALNLAAAVNGEEVDAILARSEVQKAQDHLKNGAKDRLDHMIQEAIARTAEGETSAPIDNDATHEAA